MLKVFINTHSDINNELIFLKADKCKENIWESRKEKFKINKLAYYSYFENGLLTGIF